MSVPYTFIISRHSVDAVNLSLKLFPESAKRRLSMITRDSTVAPHFLGHSCPAEYAGLSGLFQYDVEALAIKKPQGDRPVYLIYPSNKESTLPQAELLDRLRVRLTSWDTVNVILSFDHIATDLPPLQPTDQVIFIWEVRDTPGAEHVERMNYLAERIAVEKPKYRGVQFYGRSGAPADAVEAARLQIESLRPSSEINLLKL